MDQIIFSLEILQSGIWMVGAYIVMLVMLAGAVAWKKHEWLKPLLIGIAVPHGAIAVIGLVGLFTRYLLVT